MNQEEYSDIKANIDVLRRKSVNCRFISSLYKIGSLTALGWGLYGSKELVENDAPLAASGALVLSLVGCGLSLLNASHFSEESDFHTVSAANLEAGLALQDSVSIEHIKNDLPSKK